jgi:hypothetical protein
MATNLVVRNVDEEVALALKEIGCISRKKCRSRAS